MILKQFYLNCLAHGSYLIGDSATQTAAVVDPQLRVHGVERLRVADASALPRIPRANTNARAVMVGERCADFLLDPCGLDPCG